MIQRTKKGLALLSATMRLCSECWNWAPTVCAFLTFLWTFRATLSRLDANDVPDASRSCDAITDAGMHDAGCSRLASVLTVSKLRQFFTARLRDVFDAERYLSRASSVDTSIDDVIFVPLVPLAPHSVSALNRPVPNFTFRSKQSTRFNNSSDFRRP